MGRPDGYDDFNEFYTASSRRVLGQVYALTGDLAAAEDAVAEAYLRAWQRWAKLERYERPEAWVRTVAMRLAMNSWHKARNRLLAHVRARDDDGDRGLGPDHVAMVAALRTLPVKLRQAAVLHYIGDLSVADIAAELGASEGTVKSWLARARQRLRAELGEDTGIGEEVPR